MDEGWTGVKKLCKRMREGRRGETGLRQDDGGTGVQTSYTGQMRERECREGGWQEGGDWDCGAIVRCSQQEEDGNVWRWRSEI